jgi:hypothetical protein
MYVLKGHKKVIINENEKILVQDNIALSLGYDTHRYLKSSDSQQLLLTLPTDLFFNYYERYGRLMLNNHFVTDTAQAKLLKPLFYKIIENKEDPYIASGYCTALLGTLTNLLGTKAVEDIEVATLTPSVVYNEELCAALGIAVPETK